MFIHEQRFIKCYPNNNKMHTRELAMKDIKNFKNRTTKELTDTALKKIEKFKRFMPPLWYRLLTDFCRLTPNQQLYIIKTIENVKKHRL